MRPEEPALCDNPDLPSTPATPAVAQFVDLKPRDLLGFLYLAFCGGLTGLALFLSSGHGPVLWVIGQVLLAVALLQWFVLLHEAGHNTLFRTQHWNRCAGHLAAYFALIPFGCWKLVHGLHHRWTGWQDLDMTTATLVPRPLSWLERVLVNVCWWSGLPLFSTLYRLNNFWNLPRLFRAFRHRRQRRQVAWSMLLLLTTYGLTAYLAGPVGLLQAVGLGLFLSLVMQDPLILSQHTHVPLQLSHGEAVQPFPAMQQEVFTRSLRFPSWFARLILLNLDAHELHHMYTRVPGYHLHKIAYAPHNEVHWWLWLRKAKRVPGEVFLFQNRNQSGYDV